MLTAKLSKYLVSDTDVLRNAEICCRRTIEAFRQPNMTSEQIRDAFEAHELDPLKEFSAACRAELLAMSSNAPPELIPDS